MFGKSNYRIWTEDELEFLGNNYETMTYKEIAKVLDRTEKAIRNKIFYERNK